MTDQKKAAEAAAAEKTEEMDAGTPADEPGADEAPAAEPGAEEAAAGEPGAREAPAGEKKERPLTDEERAELYKEQLKALRLLDVAREMMLTLVTVGYQKLGLTDETRELRDLGEAHLAIELLRGIVGAIEDVADAEEIETYRSTLAQMQLNYARAAGGS